MGKQVHANPRVKSSEPKAARSHSNRSDSPIVRTVAISLCDNDFGSVIGPLLRSIRYLSIEKEATNKELVTMAIKEGMAFHVVMAHRWEHSILSQVELLDTCTYLLNNIKILFNEEADIACLTLDNDGGSWHLDFSSGSVTSY